MARRSDHTRVELEALIVDAGHRLMGEVGFVRFSAREVAKRVGYSIGTLYNVFGSHDGLILAINARTVGLWAQHLRETLADAGLERMDALVRGYFAFAFTHPRTWAAVYDYRLSPGENLPAWYARTLAELTGIVDAEVARALPRRRDPATLARSLLAVVHGHCVLAIDGTFDRLGELDPVGAAIARVNEALAAAEAYDGRRPALG